MKKKCSSCKIWKNTWDFYKDKTRVTGLDYYCKECKKKKIKKHSDLTPEQKQRKLELQRVRRAKARQAKIDAEQHD